MIRTPIERLYKGELSFEAFTLQTRWYWENQARKMLYRWSAPSSVSVDDLVQEMLFKCWGLMKKYEPNKSVIHKYIIWNCVSHAKRWLHKQRGAKGHDGKSPSRFPFLADQGDFLPMINENMRVEPDQELAIKRLEKINLASNLKERLILNRLSRIPSIDLVTQDLYNDPKIKLYLRLNSLKDARRAVYRSVLKISNRV
jgi:DNA-directed RNA polymerase specialized sigma24 family protein